MNILVISLAGIGDTLIATPLIHELRLQYPQAQLEALVLWPGARDLLAGNPHLNAVHQQNFFELGALGTARFLLELRRRRYDLSVNTHPQSKIHYRLVAWLVGARLRLSHIYDNWTPLDPWLANRSLPQDYGVHSIENNLRLLRLLDRQPKLAEPAFELFLSPAEEASAQSLREELRLAGRRVVGLHVGSGKTKNLRFKRWPLESWIPLIQRVTQEHPEVTVVLFGGPEEAEENDRILREASHPNLVRPRTRSLREAAALLRYCEVFVSVDNMFMHLAATLRVPKQILIESPAFGPTLAPYRRPYTLVPNPAVHGRNLDYYRYDGRGIRGSPLELRRCMEAVTVAGVYSAIQAALDQPAE